MREENNSSHNPTSKVWVEKIEFEVLGNLRTDFTLMTYTNEPSRNNQKAKSLAKRSEQ